MATPVAVVLSMGAWAGSGREWLCKYGLFRKASSSAGPDHTNALTIASNNIGLKQPKLLS